jgi:hypothetical protein
VTGSVYDVHRQHLISAHSPGACRSGLPRPIKHSQVLGVDLDRCAQGFAQTVDQETLPHRREPLYEAAESQRGTDCLDRLLASLDFDTLEGVLMGLLAQLRNQSAIDGADRSLTWSSALTFVTDILRYGRSTAGIRAGAIESA